MDDLHDLYQSIILQHNRRPLNERVMDPFTHEAEGFNPLCGDRVHVYLDVEGGKVCDISFIGEGCAISRASASIMTKQLRGLSEEEVADKIHEVVDLLTRVEDPVMDLAEYGDLAALAGVRRFPVRIKCATLAWHAVEEALAGSGFRAG